MISGHQEVDLKSALYSYENLDCLIDDGKEDTGAEITEQSAYPPGELKKESIIDNDDFNLKCNSFKSISWTDFVQRNNDSTLMKEIILKEDLNEMRSVFASNPSNEESISSLFRKSDSMPNTSKQKSLPSIIDAKNNSNETAGSRPAHSKHYSHITEDTGSSTIIIDGATELACESQIIVANQTSESNIDLNDESEDSVVVIDVNAVKTNSIPPEGIMVLDEPLPDKENMTALNKKSDDASSVSDNLTRVKVPDEIVILDSDDCDNDNSNLSDDDVEIICEKVLPTQPLLVPTLKFKTLNDLISHYPNASIIPATEMNPSSLPGTYVVKFPTPVSSTSPLPTSSPPSSTSSLIPHTRTSLTPTAVPDSPTYTLPLSTSTSPPPTSASPPPTSTSPPSTSTSPLPTRTSPPSTSTSPPPMSTSSPLTSTSHPPMSTSSPLTSTSHPLTSTSHPLTSTSPPPTSTSPPPTSTSHPPTSTSPPLISTSPPPLVIKSEATVSSSAPDFPSRGSSLVLEVENVKVEDIILKSETGFQEISHGSSASENTIECEKIYQRHYC